MAILLTKAGRVQLARSFNRDIVNGRDHYHFALAKTTAWDDEEIPDTPLESEKFLKEFRSNVIFTQLVSPADICHLVRRIDWTEGTVYDPYDDAYSEKMPSYSGATNLADANFYVITDENNVYKCIDNNNNSPSLEKPTYTTTDTDITPSDGYVWKFMFQVSASDETKFLNAEHIPTRKLTTMPYGDVNGELDSISVTNGGSGYTSIPNVVINGDGINAAATAVLTAGVVTGITIDEPGSGYSFANITFTGGGEGSGATAVASLGDTDIIPALQEAVEVGAIPGSIDRIVILNGGQDYTSDDVLVTITGDGTGAEATAIISGGAVTGFNIDAKGTGYTNATISITDSLGENTSASARIVLSPIDGHGSHAINELFASTIGVTVSLSENFNPDLFLDNDFRQIGLIKNIKEYNKINDRTVTTSTACFIANVNVDDNSSSYAVDDIIHTDNGGEFRVIQIKESTSTTYDIYLQSIIPLITASSTLTNNTQETIPSLSINSVTDPEINPSTGDVVYIENRPAISRSEDQVETIKALVNF